MQKKKIATSSKLQYFTHLWKERTEGRWLSANLVFEDRELPQILLDPNQKITITITMTMSIRINQNLVKKFQGNSALLKCKPQISLFYISPTFIIFNIKLGSAVSVSVFLTIWYVLWVTGMLGLGIQYTRGGALERFNQHSCVILQGASKKIYTV